MSLCLYVLFCVYHVVCGLVHKNKKKGNFEIGSQPVVHFLKRNINVAKCQYEHVAEKNTLVLRMSLFSCIVEPRFNKGQKNWQNVFAILNFFYTDVLFHTSYYDSGKEIQECGIFAIKKAQLDLQDSQNLSYRWLYLYLQSY